MSDEAADWVKAQKQIFAQRPLVASSPPAKKWRRDIHALVYSTKFEVAVMVIILANMLQMALDWWEPVYAYPDGQWASTTTLNAPFMSTWKDVMRVVNQIFLALYIIEMLLKWAGKTMRVYFSNAWDIFDFVLVCTATFEVIMSSVGLSGIPFPPTLIRVLRLFRVVRLLRVIKTAKSLRTIIMTVWVSLPQLSNIFVLISLVVVIFDILCVTFFWSVNYTPGNFDPGLNVHEHSAAMREYVKPDGTTVQVPGEDLPWTRPDYDSIYFYADDRTNWGDALNRHANFAYFWTGALLLVRASTGEFFNGIMHDCHSWSWGHNRLTCCPECGPILDGVLQENVQIPSTGLTVNRIKPESSCGSTGFAWLFFFLFQVLMAYLVLSIMIGVILENFANIGSTSGRLNMDDLEEFRELWLKFDPKGTFITPAHNLTAILQQLKQPLGIADAHPPKTRAQMFELLGRLDIPVHSGRIHFMETLVAFANEQIGTPVPVCDATKKMTKNAQKIPKLNSMDKPTHNALAEYQLSLLQARWRAYTTRKTFDNSEGTAANGGPKKDVFRSHRIAPE